MDTHRYLVIGGSTKCGTTSVFKYFEYHPEVCPCVMKESRYFWKNEYPLTAAGRAASSREKFASLFKGCSSNQLRVEATPDYLYSKASAQAIHGELQDCKLVFILRHPVQRLISWYNFSLVNGFILPHTTFADYVTSQQNSQSGNPPQHLRSLEQGLYASYLENYYAFFGSENILVVFYEDLMADTGKFCRSIARFAGINENYFSNFDFRIFNKTVPAKSVGAHRFFRKFKRSIRPVTRLFSDSVRKKLKLAGQKLEASYQQANKNESGKEPEISQELHQFLIEYYTPGTKKLQELTGKNIPWKDISIQ